MKLLPFGSSVSGCHQAPERETSSRPASSTMDSKDVQMGDIEDELAEPRARLSLETPEQLTPDCGPQSLFLFGGGASMTQGARDQSQTPDRKLCAIWRLWQLPPRTQRRITKIHVLRLRAQPATRSIFVLVLLPSRGTRCVIRGGSIGPEAFGFTKESQLPA